MSTSVKLYRSELGQAIRLALRAHVEHFVIAFRTFPHARGFVRRGKFYDLNWNRQ